jgi:general secretion pathway protein G
LLIIIIDPSLCRAAGASPGAYLLRLSAGVIGRFSVESQGVRMTSPVACRSFASLALLFAVPMMVAAENPPARPPFDRLRVVYKTKSRVLDPKGHVQFTSTGRETKAIDVVANKKRSERREVTRMGTYRNVTENIERFDGKTFNRIDPVAKTGNFLNLHGQTKAVWDEVNAEENFFIGEEKILGRPCKVYGYEDTKIWAWNGVILKQEVKYKSASQESVAVKIKENPKLKPTLFDVPKDVEIQTFGESVAGTLSNLFSTMDEIKAMRSYAGKHAASGGGDAAEERAALERDREAAGITRAAAALEKYKADVGGYPTLQQGLAALAARPKARPPLSRWSGPYLTSAKDAWGTDLVYRLPGLHNPDTFDLYSKGPNGTGDGLEPDDVNNWK